jgi:hypothetical protein
MCKQNRKSDEDTAHETKVAIEICVIPEKQSIKIENPSWGGTNKVPRKRSERNKVSEECSRANGSGLTNVIH